VLWAGASSASTRRGGLRLSYATRAPTQPLMGTRAARPRLTLFPRLHPFPRAEKAARGTRVALGMRLATRGLHGSAAPPPSGAASSSRSVAPRAVGGLGAAWVGVEGRYVRAAAPCCRGCRRGRCARSSCSPRAPPSPEATCIPPGAPALAPAPTRARTKTRTLRLYAPLTMLAALLFSPSSNSPC